MAPRGRLEGAANLDGGGPESARIRGRPALAGFDRSRCYCAVRKNEDDSVWFPLASIASTSHS